MAFVHAQFRYTGAVPQMMRRSLNRVTKEAWRAVGAHWHQHFRPRHFEQRWASYYSYLPRKGQSGNPDMHGFNRSYTGRKLRTFGHTRPLVLTGESMLRTKQRDVRSTSKGVRVVLHAPKFNFRNRYSNIVMHEELTRLPGEELNELARVFDREMLRQFRMRAETEAILGGYG